MTAYLFDNLALPIAYKEEDILPALRAPFTRAVTVRIPKLAFDPAGIIAPDDVALAKLYWKDEQDSRGRKSAGRQEYYNDMTVEIIQREATEAKILLSSDAAKAFTDRCNEYRRIFTDVICAYTGLHGLPMRGWTMFTPKGGQGRAPDLHIDNTVLTLHWSAALSGVSLCEGVPAEAIWDAFNRVKLSARLAAVKDNQNIADQIRQQNTEILLEAAKDKTLDIRDNQIGDIILMKGQRNRDLLDPKVRQTVCIHTSSSSIKENGQAGFIMTPEMP